MAVFIITKNQYQPSGHKYKNAIVKKKKKCKEFIE